MEVASKIGIQLMRDRSLKMLMNFEFSRAWNYDEGIYFIRNLARFGIYWNFLNEFHQQIVVLLKLESWHRINNISIKYGTLRQLSSKKKSSIFLKRKLICKDSA